MANVGYPIVEAEPDGSFAITKHAGTGGRVSADVVKEQLLYELGDPRNYITPDCVADFTSIRLRDDGVDRVRVSGIR
ncbi:acyclic terpene utilization AtuA family protein, partial [Staphylococcus aureus]|uniref:acyclic terpene utilization AtuA family protein n=1 Tax=Staphylococcus aureus TaxID=1280 RepID=UPI003FA6AE46